MTTTSPVTRVDHSALRVNQAGIVLTVLLALGLSAFTHAALWLIPALGIVLLVGTFNGNLALFKQLYFRVLRGRLVAPRVIEDRPEPHNFAQGLGGIFLAVASLLLLVAPAVGLALALVVALLAFVNLAFNYCLGCQIYFFLGRRGLLRTGAAG